MFNSYKQFLILGLTLFSLKSLSTQSNCDINPNFINSTGLKHYWPFCKTLKDVIGYADLFNPSNANFYQDRNNAPIAAVSISNGNLQAPAGVYFDGGDYTVMTWIYPFIIFQRPVIFCSANFPQDLLVFGLAADYLGLVSNQISSDSKLCTFRSTVPLFLKTWQHVSLVYVSSLQTAKIFLNGKLVRKRIMLF